MKIATVFTGLCERLIKRMESRDNVAAIEVLQEIEQLSLDRRPVRGLDEVTHQNGNRSTVATVLDFLTDKEHEITVYRTIKPSESFDGSLDLEEDYYFDLPEIVRGWIKVYEGEPAEDALDPPLQQAESVQLFHDFFEPHMEQQRRQGNLPEPVCFELLKWWMEWDGGQTWHPIGYTPQTDVASKVRHEQFNRGLTSFLTVRGLLRCRSHVKFWSNGDEYRLIEMVFDWGGGGESCKEAAIEALKQKDLWPSTWPNDADGLGWEETHIAVSERYKHLVPDHWTVPPDQQQIELQRMFDAFPNFLTLQKSIKYCGDRAGTFDNEHKPVAFWKSSADDGEPVAYPFGEAGEKTAASTEAEKATTVATCSQKTSTIVHSKTQTKKKTKIKRRPWNDRGTTVSSAYVDACAEAGDELDLKPWIEKYLRRKAVDWSATTEYRRMLDNREEWHALLQTALNPPR